MILPVSFILGAGVGSFVNVLASRAVTGQSFILPRSFCDACAKPLFRRDLIPILSFFLLKAKCRFCKTKIAWRYPIVELAAAALFTYAAWSIFGQNHGIVYDTGAGLWALLLHSWTSITALMALFLTDLRAMVLPDRITLPAIAALAVIDFLFLGAEPKAVGLAVVLGGGFFLAQYILSRGKWVGSGDIRFGVLMGLILLSWEGTIAALAAAYVIGAIVSIILLVSRRKTLKSQVPLGIFLSIGTLIVMFFGNLSV